MARVSRRSTTPIATGERLVAAFGCRELIEKGIVDILQTDINHVGGITGLWKVAALANFTSSFRKYAASLSRATRSESGQSGSDSNQCAWSTDAFRYHRNQASVLN